MKIQPLNLSPISINNRSLKPQMNSAVSSPFVQNQIGAFPSYYCPNISFGHKFEDDNFDDEFYECAENVLNNHLDKMELTKDLSETNQNDFRETIFYGDDVTNIFQFFNNKKPSVLLVGHLPYFENNDKYDFVRKTIESKWGNKVIDTTDITFVLNKELVKETIEENKELYTKRMGLDENSGIDEIYEKLIDEDGPLKNGDGFDDIIGVTLGYSPINSVLFQLENEIPQGYRYRRTPAVLSEKLGEKLHSEYCVYKDFSKGFLSNVENSIDKIKTLGPYDIGSCPVSSVGILYIEFIEDEKYLAKVVKDSEEILEKNKS